jgi:pentatricopeptide repeat protein
VGMLKGVLQACGKAGEPAAAREAFESVRACGLHPDSFCWGALMKAHR